MTILSIIPLTLWNCTRLFTFITAVPYFNVLGWVVVTTSHLFLFKHSLNEA